MAVGQGLVLPPVSSRRDLVAALAQAREDLHRSRREIRDLRRENEVLWQAAAPLVHQSAARERFAFIHARRDRFSVKLLCRVLVIDRGNYLGWVRSLDGGRGRAYTDQQLTQLILEVHTAYPAYGVPRVTRELQRQGIVVGWRVVTRLMRANGISGKTWRKRRSLTKPDTATVAVPDLVRCDFSAPMPGLKVVGDISRFGTGEGWVYLVKVPGLTVVREHGAAKKSHVHGESAPQRAQRTSASAIERTPDLGLARKAAACRLDRTKVLSIRNGSVAEVGVGWVLRRPAP